MFSMESWISCVPPHKILHNHSACGTRVAPMMWNSMEAGAQPDFSKWGDGKGDWAVSRGADWDSKWQLSIDLCTECNFICGAKRGGRVSAGGSPPAPPPLATPLDGSKRRIFKFWLLFGLMQITAHKLKGTGALLHLANQTPSYWHNLK